MTPEIEPFSLPLSRPLSTATGTIDSREGFLVRVSIEGTTGIGEATPLAGWTEPSEECEAALRSIDDPVAAIERDDGLRSRPAARHGLALAVLDARARAAGEPLYRHLGATERVERVPVNATVGDSPPKTTADAAVEATAAGFETVKIKVGRRSLTADLERLAAVREACPGVEMRADANGVWSRTVATRALQATGVYGLSFVEQPVPAADLADLSELSGGSVGVAADEAVVEHGIDAVLESGVDVVVLKPMALGGIDRTRRAAKKAAEDGTDVVVTTTIDGAYARTAAVHLVASLHSVSAVLPAGLATGDRLTHDLCDGPSVTAGSIRVPQHEGNIKLD
ncbi:MAG: o-succinylbenzoate synthase [Natronomonas sp.]